MNSFAFDGTAGANALTDGTVQERARERTAKSARSTRVGTGVAKLQETTALQSNPPSAAVVG